MASLNLTKRDLENHKFKGVSYEAEHALACSACEAPLVRIVVVRSDCDVEMNYAARCPHCGDRSFSKKVKGMIVLGGTDFTHYTSVEPQVGSDGEEVAMIFTEKVAEYAQR